MINSSSVIYLNSDALRNNLDFLRQTLPGDVRISSVVKGNAYGHGIAQFVPLAESCGINHFSVFSAEEAYAVWQASAKGSTLMIMGDIHEEDLPWAIENDIEFFVFEHSRVDKALDIARKMGRKAKIHIELETGMNRTGFDKKGLTRLLKTLSGRESDYSLEGICTHFAGAESVANYVRVKNQISVYNKLVKWLSNKGFNPTYRHAACSAAAITYPNTCFDMVRIGILQYGFWPSRETFIQYLSKKELAGRQDPLQRVISWESQVMSVKDVACGEFIGYGTSFLAQHDIRVATVPVGYSLGYSRVLSNQGRALINGTRVGVIGVVNMNMMMLDVTEVDVEPGDKVCLIGGGNGLEISVASFGELSNQLNYELLTRLPERIPRLIK